MTKNAKLRAFIEDEIACMYGEVEALGDEATPEDYLVVEVIEDLAHTLFVAPDEDFRRLALKRLAVLFQNSPNYKEEWRP